VVANMDWGNKGGACVGKGSVGYLNEKIDLSLFIRQSLFVTLPKNAIFLKKIMLNF
jgi:hypothetical protein